MDRLPKPKPSIICWHPLKNEIQTINFWSQEEKKDSFKYFSQLTRCLKGPNVLSSVKKKKIKSPILQTPPFLIADKWTIAT